MAQSLSQQMDGNYSLRRVAQGIGQQKTLCPVESISHSSTITYRRRMASAESISI